jgi:hypothetical protein
MAVDLRDIVGILRIASNLERIGDLYQVPEIVTRGQFPG